MGAAPGCGDVLWKRGFLTLWVREVIICCVSSNWRTCPISEGINGVMATSQVLQMQPWCFKEGKSNPPLSETILGKGKKKFIRNNPIN